MFERKGSIIKSIRYSVRDVLLNSRYPVEYEHTMNKNKATIFSSLFFFQFYNRVSPSRPLHRYRRASLDPCFNIAFVRRIFENNEPGYISGNVFFSNQTDDRARSCSFLGEPKGPKADRRNEPVVKAGLVTTMQISFGPAQFFTHERLRH